MTQLTAAPGGSWRPPVVGTRALALSVLVVGLDVFVLTLAIPTLSVDLHASTSDAQWFLDAYSLVLAGALLPAGLLGDRYGRKKLLLWALVLFGLASLACAYSTSSGELIAARVALGLAAAVITAALARGAAGHVHARRSGPGPSRSSAAPRSSASRSARSSAAGCLTTTGGARYS